MAAAYRIELPAATQAVYLEALKDVREVTLERGCTEVCKRSKFFPSIAELCEIVIEVALDEHHKLASTNIGEDKPSTFKVEQVYEEIDLAAKEIYELDRHFELTGVDHIWPKTSSTDRKCRCPKHQHATNGLWWVCYDRIMEAKRGVMPKPASHIAKGLAVPGIA